MSYPRPHLEKLQATLKSDKLPTEDKPRIEQTIDYYNQWIKYLDAIIVSEETEENLLRKMIQLLNEYKLYVDVDLIFDSPSDFLYRQKGQLKLDNSILEEFLPHLINSRFLPKFQNEVIIGPLKAFSAVYFDSSLDVPRVGGGLEIREKDQDFAIGKKLYLKASHSQNFEPQYVTEKSTNLIYIAAECKTNLDKTMFQEACATAHDVKSAVSGAKYYLLCEWLDMTPMSTAPTDIDEVLILRKAKRLGSNVRSKFSTFQGRQTSREQYVNYLKSHPLELEIFQRFLNHVRKLLNSEMPVERDILSQGYF
ncbi:MAG: Bpu10I family restriction endonuclease [Chloroflexota bacterium]